MNYLSIEDRVWIITSFIKNNESPTLVKRQWAKEKTNRQVPTDKTIRLIMKRFKTGQIASAKPPGPEKTVVIPENLKRVSELIAENPKTSVRRGSQELGISKSSFHNILRKNLKLFPYKLSVVQLLTDVQKERRLLFAEELLEKIQSEEVKVNNIWFSDECHFHLNGYVNRQNYRIWGSENPHLTLEKQAHPVRVTVWCAISAQGIIGPFFFDETVNADRYLEMLKKCFIPEAKKQKAIDLWHFMQDGARPHRTESIFDFLKSKFGNRIIALDAGDDCITWPPYSPDLNPCDFFVWGCIKDRLYTSKINSKDELRNRVKSLLEGVDVETCASAMSNFASRLQFVRTVNGGHFEIYK